MNTYTKILNIVVASDKVLEGAVGRVTSDVLEVTNKGKTYRIEKQDFITARTKQEQLDALADMFQKGLITPEKLEERKASINKTPDFVFAHLHFKADGDYVPFGDILTRRDGSGKYLKIKCDSLTSIDTGKSVRFLKDQILSVSSRDGEKKRIKYLLDNNRMKQETYDRVLSDIESQPDFIIYRVDGKGQEL